jgi:hypothetical protein
MDQSQQDAWALSEKETACLFNCSKSYVQLKGILHDQLLKDYRTVNMNNRELFKNI